MRSILIAAFSATVAVLVTALLNKWPARLWAFLRSRIRPDHSSLCGSPAWALSSTTSACDRVHVQVVAAPDRALPFRVLGPDFERPLFDAEVGVEVPGRRLNLLV